MRTSFSNLENVFVFLVQVPKAQLLVISQDELLVSYPQQLVVGDLLVFFLLHDQVKLFVIDQDRCFFLHDDVVVEGVNERNCHFQLMDLLQSVLVVCVDLINRELVFTQSIDLVVLTQLDLLYVPCNLVISNLFGIEVNDSHLRFALSSLSKKIIHFSVLSLLESDDPLKRIQLDRMVLDCVFNLSFLALFLLVLSKRTPLKDILLGLILRDFIQDEDYTAIKSHNRRVDIDFVLQLLNSFLGNSSILLKIKYFHLVIFFDCKLIIDLFANGSLQEQTDLSIVHFHHFADDFSRETMNSDFFVISPDQNILFLDIDPNQLSFSIQVQVFHRVFIRLSKERRFSVVLQLPALDSLVRNAVILPLLPIFDENFSELFFFICEGAHFLASFLGTNIDLVEVDLTEMHVVDISQMVDVFDSTVAFLFFAGRIQLNHTIGALPVEVDLRLVIDGLDDCHFESIFSTVFELRESHVKRLESFVDDSSFSELPKVEQLVLSLLVGCQNGQVIIFGFHVLNHRWQSSRASLDCLEVIKANDFEVVHPEDGYVIVVDSPHFGTEDVVLADDFY